MLVTGASFYVASKNRTADLEHRLTELEVINRQQEKTIDSHNRRLDKQEEEQKITLALVERIDSLSRNINDLKNDMSEIKDTIGKL